MVKPLGEGIYSATYSGIPVYEFQFGADLKEHVMRRRHDNWINATHILKAAGFDKPARTRILEREVQKGTHEKIQGGYGKYQGTWIPLEEGEGLALRNNTYDRLKPIFEFMPGNQSPPPAPRHTSKPKQPKRPAVPKWNAPPPPEEFDNGDVGMLDDDTPDNLTIASNSYMVEDDRHDVSHYSAGTGHRKRKREEMLQDMTEQQHSVYGDELLDYFLLARNEQPAIRPDPPTNFQPNWVIDTERHTALHWASAMGDVDVIKQLKRFNASLSVQNERGETPFMRSVNFTNCYEKQTFPAVMKELWDTVDSRDSTNCTVIHHAAVMKSGRVTSHSCSRYYLDNILNRLQETRDPNFVQKFIDAQDNDGNTAVHLAAKINASKCIRALLGRGASTDIPNREGIRAEDLIKELNASKKARTAPQRSSSPFAPDTQRHPTFRDALGPEPSKHLAPTFTSAAAATVNNRVTALVSEKFAALAQAYEDEFKDKVDAEAEARRLLADAGAELARVRGVLAELDALVDDVAAAKTAADAALARKSVLSLVTHYNRLAVHANVAADALPNGDAASAASQGQQGSNGSGDERLVLAGELQRLLLEQRQAEADYVEALGREGADGKIELYRRLLKTCLGPEGAESLEDNVDGMIAMMEEEAADSRRNGAGGVVGGEAMEIAA